MSLSRRQSDAELVQRGLSGDRSGFDMLVDRYRDRIYRLMLYRTKRADLAEDLAQDAFVAAYRALPQISDPGRFGAWLRRLAINVCSGWLRGRREEHPSLDESLIDSGDDPLLYAERRSIVEMIEDALSHLSDTNRDTARMYFVEGLSLREVADAQDLPMTTVKRRINLARTRLRKGMTDIMEDEFRSQTSSPEFVPKVSARVEVLRWYRLFSRYIESGTGLVRLLHRLSQADFPEPIRRETRAIQRAIENGETLSGAVAGHAPTLNHPKAVGLIYAGEIGGTLEWSMNALVTWAEHEDLSRRIDAAYWMRTFASMLSAGVPIRQAAEVMSRVKASEPLAALPDALIEALTTCRRISDAFDRYPDVFAQNVVALIRAGEVSGLLDTALDLAASAILREVRTGITSAPSLSNGAEGSRGLAETLSAQLDDTSSEARIGALQALDGIDSDGSLTCRAAVRLLSDDDAAVRREAARILRRRPSPDAVQPLLRMMHEVTPASRSEALFAMDAIDRPAAIRSAERLITDGSEEVRLACVSVLSRGPLPRSAALLVGMLGDADLPVADAAMKALVSIGASAVPALLEAAEAASPAAAIGPLDVLARVDPAAARQVALRLLDQRPVPGGSRAPISTLARIADPEDAPYLIAALSDEDDLVVRDAIDGLGKMRAAGAVPALIEILDSKRDWLAARAAGALGRVGDISAAPSLAGKFSEDSPRHVVAACLDALAELGASGYSDAAVEMVLAFGRRGERVGDGPVRMVDREGVRRMVGALSDPETAATAAYFLCNLVTWRDDGVSLAKEAGTVPALVLALGGRRSSEILAPAVCTLVRMAGREETTRLITEASVRGEIDQATADRALAIAGACVA